MKKKFYLKKFLINILSVSLVLQSGFSNPNIIYAEPVEQEAQISENVAQTDASENTVSVKEESGDVSEITPSSNEPVYDQESEEVAEVVETKTQSVNSVENNTDPEEETKEQEILSSNKTDSVSDNETDSVSDNGTVSDDVVDKREIVGGYIEMPWDNNTPVVEEDENYVQLVEKIVDEDVRINSDGSIETPVQLDYVQTPESIEAKFPDLESEQAILNYLKDNYPDTRSQSPYGTCWAHSSIALTEFYMIKHGLKDSTGVVGKDVNYSESQLAYFCYHQTPDGIVGDTGDRLSYDKDGGDKVNYLDIGGNLNHSAQSLMRYNGVADETDEALKYENAADTINDGLDDEYATSGNVVHLKNAYLININQNPLIVKQAIKENGIVGVSYYSDTGKYLNKTTNAYYNNVDATTNHAVAIVGWDDGYSKENFLEGKRPENDGAWLIRNSWTTNTEFSVYSYFWLSYEDKSLADTAYVFEMADRENGEEYDNNYNYDSQLHHTGSSGYTKVANVFTAQKNSESLKAVQIESTTRIPGDYTVEIYKNLTDSDNPESGSKINDATTVGNLPFAGKYTISLNAPVELTQGENFAVVVTTQKPVDREYDLNIDDQVKGTVAINQGESFYYSESSWEDYINMAGSAGNLCIRALTNNSEASLPASINSLSVKSRTDSTISFVWSAADAEKYEIWKAAGDSDEFTKAGEVEASERKFTVSGLSAVTTYKFKVYPVKNSSKVENGVSPEVSVSTLASIPVPELVKKGNYTATIRWDA
ncbi:MAG: hypothetical protein K6F99_04585, partial [Lachnospiraceae bacterium]|nr:hypothetical protein [Lachnospiraceae bacterium]